jgi:hypothetical protein
MLYVDKESTCILDKESVLLFIQIQVILNFLCWTITFFPLHVGRPLWWEDGSVICSAITHRLELCMTQNHILLRLPPTWIARSLYIYTHTQDDPVIPPCTGSVFFVSCDLQGYGGGILTCLHTGPAFCLLYIKYIFIILAVWLISVLITLHANQFLKSLKSCPSNKPNEYLTFIFLSNTLIFSCYVQWSKNISANIRKRTTGRNINQVHDEMRIDFGNVCYYLFQNYYSFFQECWRQTHLFLKQ